MKPARSVLAGVVVTLGVAAGAVYALARRVSKKTGKSTLASLTSVPAEAQSLVSTTKAEVTETASHLKESSTEAVSGRLATLRETGASLKNRISIRGGGAEAESGSPEAEPVAAETETSTAAED